MAFNSLSFVQEPNLMLRLRLVIGLSWCYADLKPKPDRKVYVKIFGTVNSNPNLSLSTDSWICWEKRPVFKS